MLQNPAKRFSRLSEFYLHLKLDKHQGLGFTEQNKTETPKSMMCLVVYVTKFTDSCFICICNYLYILHVLIIRYSQTFVVITIFLAKNLFSLTSLIKTPSPRSYLINLFTKTCSYMITRLWFITHTRDTPQEESLVRSSITC